MNDLSIEGIDEEGRATLKSINLNGRESVESSRSSGGGLKWKRKSELSKPISDDKYRISIKGPNIYEYKNKPDSPFN